MNPLSIVECIVQAAVGCEPAVRLAEMRLRHRVAGLTEHQVLLPVRAGAPKPALR